MNEGEGVESSAEVLDQVLRIFAANREPDQVIGDPSLLSDLRREARVGHGSWMLDQGLDAPERYRQHRECDLFHELPARLQPPVDPEAEDSPRPVHLPLSQIALGMVRGSWIPDPLHGRMLVEHLRDETGTNLSLPHPQTHSL